MINSSQTLSKKDHGVTQNKKQEELPKETNKGKQQEQNSQTTNKKLKCLNFFKLYYYADKFDALLIFLGLILSIATGCGLPFFALVAGEMIDSFDYQGEEMVQRTSKARNQFLFIGAGTFFAAWMCVVVWMKLGQRISLKCRKLYLKSLMKHKISFFKNINEQQFTQEIQTCFLNFREALGFKVGTFIFIAASLIAGGRNAISTGWLLSLIMVSTLPLLGLSGVLYTFLVQLKKSKLSKYFQRASQRSKKVIYNLKSVKRLTAEEYELSVFEKYCRGLRNKVVMYSCLTGLGSGWFSLVQFGVYALAFWFGSHCVEGTYPCPSRDQNDKYTPGEVIVIFFAFYVRLDSMQQILPTLRKIYAGMQAAYKIYEVIKYENQEVFSDSLSRVILTDHFKGKIQFKNVTFYAKNNTSRKILDDLTFDLDSKFIGFYGSKEETSAIMNLIMRFQDPDQGSIYIDGIQIKKLNVQQLRNKFGYSESNNGLFETTLRQNLIQQRKIYDEDIFKVLRELDIYDSIKIYQDKLNINIGFEGKKLNNKIRKKLILSRIILKKPKIIIFTQLSSLESQSESFNLYQKLRNLSASTNFFIYFGNNKKILGQMDKVFIITEGIIEKVHIIQKQKSPIPFIESFFISNGSKELQKSLHKSQVQQVLNLSAHQSTLYHDESPQSSQINHEQRNLKYYQKQILSRIFTNVSQFRLFYLIGLFFSFLSGLLYPAFTIFLADILLQTFKFKNQPYESTFIRQNIEKPVLIIVYIGVSSFLINIVENTIFSVIGQKITQKIRNQTYNKILYLPMNWFYSGPLHTPFKVHKILVQSSNFIKTIPTQLFPIIFKSMVSAIAGFIIAFIFQWRTAFLGIIVLPMMIGSGLMLVKFFYENDTQTINMYKKTSSVFTQVIKNINYVKSQNFEELILRHYEQKLKQCEKSSIQRSHIVGIRFGLSQFLIFASFTIMFYFGSLFLRDHPDSVTVLSLFSAIFAIIWPGWTSGSYFFRVPDFKMTKRLSANLFNVMDSIDQKEIQINENSQLLQIQIAGKISFKGVKVFSEQSDSSLENIAFEIAQKQKALIFNRSGLCLNYLADILLRFQPIQQGEVYIDNIRLSDFKISSLRKQIGIIGINDFTSLFEDQIRENICYNSHNLSEKDLRQVCDMVNLTDRVFKQQRNQNTQRLSGQNIVQQKRYLNQSELQATQNKLVEFIQLDKIKISIAQTLLKNPKILLIDNRKIASIFQNKENFTQFLAKISFSKTCLIYPNDRNCFQSTDKIIIFNDKQTNIWSTLQHTKWENNQFLIMIQEKYLMK